MKTQIKKSPKKITVKKMICAVISCCLILPGNTSLAGMTEPVLAGSQLSVPATTQDGVVMEDGVAPVVPSTAVDFLAGDTPLSTADTGTAAAMGLTVVSPVETNLRAITDLPLKRDYWNELMTITSGNYPEVHVDAYQTMVFATTKSPGQGGGVTFDDFSTPAIETYDMSLLGSLTIAAASNTAFLKFELVSGAPETGDEKKGAVILSGFVPGEIKTFRLDLAEFARQGVDLKKVRLLFMINTQDKPADFVFFAKPSSAELQSAANGRFKAHAVDQDSLLILPTGSEGATRRVFFEGRAASMRFLAVNPDNPRDVLEITDAGGKKHYCVHTIYSGVEYWTGIERMMTPDESRLVYFAGTSGLFLHDVKTGEEDLINVAPFVEYGLPYSFEHTHERRSFLNDRYAVIFTRNGIEGGGGNFLRVQIVDLKDSRHSFRELVIRLSDTENMSGYLFQRGAFDAGSDTGRIVLQNGYRIVFDAAAGAILSNGFDNLPAGWIRTASNENFAYFIETRESGGYLYAKTMIWDLVKNVQHNFGEVQLAAGTNARQVISVDVPAHGRYAVWKGPFATNVSTVYYHFETRASGWSLARSNSNYVFISKYDGVGSHYALNLATGQTFGVGQSFAHSYYSPVDISSNGRWFILNYWGYGPDQYWTRVFEIGPQGLEGGLYGAYSLSRQIAEEISFTGPDQITVKSHPAFFSYYYDDALWQTEVFDLSTKTSVSKSYAVNTQIGEGMLKDGKLLFQMYNNVLLFDAGRGTDQMTLIKSNMVLTQDTYYPVILDWKYEASPYLKRVTVRYSIHEDGSCEGENSCRTAVFEDVNLPAGWTRTVSNNNYAFWTGDSNCTAGVCSTTVLKIMDMRTGVMSVIDAFAKSQGAGSYGGIDVTGEDTPGGPVAIWNLTGLSSGSVVAVKRVASPTVGITLAGKLLSAERQNGLMVLQIEKQPDAVQTVKIDLLTLQITFQQTVFQVSPGQSIQSAINRAVSGDVIRVSAGTYQGYLSLKAGILLEGIPAADGTRPVLALLQSSFLLAKNNVLRGFTLRGANGAPVMVYVPSSAPSVTIEDIKIESGYLYVMSSYNRINRVVVHRDTGTALYLYSGNNTVTGSVFYSKASSGFVAMVMSYATGGNLLDGNTFAGRGVTGASTYQYGLYVYRSAGAPDRVTNSIIAGVLYDIYSPFQPVEVSYSLLQSGRMLGRVTQGAGVLKGLDPQFVNPAAGDFRLKLFSPAIGKADPVSARKCLGAYEHDSAAFRYLDADADWKISASEAGQGLTALVNYLNISGPKAASQANGNLHFDMNGDGWVTPLDALLLVNFINANPQS